MKKAWASKTGRERWLFLGIVMLLGGLAAGSESFDNEKLIQMLKAGTSLRVIKKKIENSACHFNSDHDRLIAISKAAKEGEMDKKDIDELQIIVIDKAGEQRKRLKELVARFVNICINYDTQAYESIMRQLMREGKQTVPYLLDHIEEENELKRKGVLDALAHIGDKTPSVVRSVRLMLNDRNPGVRAEAAKTVAALSGPGTIAELVADLQRPRLEHLDGIAMALGYLRDPKAVEPLTKMLERSEDKDARLASAFSLGLLRTRQPRALKALRKGVLDEHDERLRTAAATALGKIGNSEGVRFVIRAYQRYRDGRAELIQALAYYRTARAIIFLISTARADNPAVRKASLKTLAAITGEDFENADEYEAWWNINKDRPEWVAHESLPRREAAPPKKNFKLKPQPQAAIP